MFVREQLLIIEHANSRAITKLPPREQVTGVCLVASLLSNVRVACMWKPQTAECFFGWDFADYVTYAFTSTAYPNVKSF